MDEDGLAQRASIWAGALMLEHLDEHESAGLVLRALKHVVAKGRTRTPDLGGSSTTEQVANAVIAVLEV